MEGLVRIVFPQNIDTVIFDFDYTLADSSPGIIESVNYAMSQLGLPASTPEAIRRTIGLSLTETLKALASPEHGHLEEAFEAHFIVRADEVMTDATRLFGFVPDTVRALSERGFNLGIVSSKYRRRIESVLDRESLRDLFSIIIGGEDVAAFKPDPAGLISATERLSSTPANVLYVGDSLTDAETARRASVPFIAVLSGVTERHEFSGHPVQHVIGSVAELPAILSDMI